MHENLEKARLVIKDSLAALKLGDKVNARRLAIEASILDPESEKPWLILAALSDLAESIVFIEKALLLNPDSIAAQHALEWVNQKFREKTNPS